MSEPIELDLSGMGPLRYAAITYFAYLCYPKDDVSRQRFTVAAAAMYVKFLRDDHEIYVPGPGVVLRAEIPQRTCRRRINRAERILFEIRLPVARDVAAPVATHRLGHQDTELPRNLIEAIEDYATKIGRDPINVRKRDWYDTRPVVHLAMGFLLATDSEQYDRQSIMQLMWDPNPDWVTKAIDYSNELLEKLMSANVVTDEHEPIVFQGKTLL